MVENKYYTVILNRLKQLYHLDDKALHQYAHPSNTDTHSIQAALSANQFLSALFQLKRQKNKVITIDSDYDADGVLSGIVLYYGLRKLGISSQINLYFPVTADGYGLTERSVSKIKKQFPDTEVLITADNGIAAFDGVAAAKKEGWQVLVTDHHLAKDVLPIADVVVDINRHDDPYPFKSISGTMVVWKLLYRFAKVVSPETMPYFDALGLLAALSTITDMMQLRDENRYYIVQMLQALNNPALLMDLANTHGAPFTGLAGLISVLRDHGKIRDEINTDTIGYYLGPLLNSARRVAGDPKAAFNVFLSETIVEAKEAAEALYKMNERRKQVVTKLKGGVIRRIKDNQAQGLDSRRGFVELVSATAGYAGLVAGDLTNTFKVPSIVFVLMRKGDSFAADVSHDTLQAALQHDTIVAASARSIEGLNLMSLLSIVDKRYPGILVSYGGHAQAAGLAIHLKFIQEFQEAFDDAVRELIIKALETAAENDQDITPISSEITLGVGESNADVVLHNRFDVRILMSAYDELLKLAPFGVGFELPQFKFEFPIDSNFRQMGKEKNHIKWETSCGLSVIVWNGADDFKAAQEAGAQSIVVKGQLSKNEFMGNVSLQLIGSDVDYVTPKFSQAAGSEM